MSGRELQRMEVLSEVLAKRPTAISAAAMLGSSTRQTRRLLTTYRGGALIHKARGRTTNTRLSGIREYVIELLRSRFADFDPSLAAEVLLEKDEAKVSRETLHVDGRGWVVAVAQAAKKLHQPRSRREAYGRADPDRRQRAPLVLGLGGTSFLPGLHRRRHGVKSSQKFAIRFNLTAICISSLKCMLG
jgi:hypothetical protein